MDWAGMLERMYLRWAESSGHKVSVVDRLEGGSDTSSVCWAQHLLSAGVHGRAAVQPPFLPKGWPAA